MMDGKKKPGLAVLIALKKMKGEKGEGKPRDMHEEAAREILDAIEADDEKALASLLHDFVVGCVNEADGKDDEEEGEEKEY